MITREAEPLLIRHSEAQRLLGIGESYYFQLVREGRIKTVGQGRLSRARYDSVKAYVAGLVAEAEAKSGELV
jgi:excisionase family DNA binding protein